MVTIVAYCEAMTITPDAPVETRMIDGIPLTPKQVTILGQEALAPAANVAEERLRRSKNLRAHCASLVASDSVKASPDISRFATLSSLIISG